MNKIIIDNVDVKDCLYYEEHFGEYWQGYWEFNDVCHESENDCKDNPNCKFKRKHVKLED